MHGEGGRANLTSLDNPPGLVARVMSARSCKISSIGAQIMITLGLAAPKDLDRDLRANASWRVTATSEGNSHPGGPVNSIARQGESLES